MLKIQEQHIVCGQNNGGLITAINVVTIIVFIVYIIKNIKQKELKLDIGISLVLGGGIGNLIDRIFRGYVIDYIDINNLFSFPIFNLADICIVLGIGIMVIDMLLEYIKMGEKI